MENESYLSGTVVEFNISEPLSILEFAWDNGANFTTTPMIPVGDGNHTLTVWAADFVPHWTIREFTFVTDDPLTLIFLDVSNGSILESGVPIIMDIRGHTGDYLYWWDNNSAELSNTFEPNQWPITPLLDGEHTLSVLISDNFGNSLLGTLNVIVANPLISIIVDYPMNNTIISETQEIHVSFSEPPQATHYCWDFGNITTELQPIPLIEGPHVLEIWALNEHNSWSYARYEWNLNINDAPTLELIYPTGGEILQGVITISWDGNDADNDPLIYSIYLSLNNQDWILVVSGLNREVYEINTNDYEEGVYYLKIVASDGILETEAYLDGKITLKHTSDNEPADTEQPLDENPFDDWESIPGYSMTILTGLLAVSIMTLTFAHKKRR